MFEALYRFAIIYANLKETHDDIKKTSAYRALDRSEKSAISYFLGLTFTKLMAAKLFDVYWLMHVDVYGQYLQPIFTGQRRPDLVGMDKLGRWYVFEAKGRSGGIDAGLVATAKKQTYGLQRIRGEQPRLRVACISYFSGESLRLHLEDPDDTDEESAELNMSEQQFVDAYYKPVEALVEQGPSELRVIGGRKLRVVNVVDAGVRIGLDVEVRNAVIRKENPREILGETIPLSQDATIGGDGVFVELSSNWSVDMMKLEPWDRRMSARRSPM